MKSPLMLIPALSWIFKSWETVLGLQNYQYSNLSFVIFYPNVNNIVIIWTTYIQPMTVLQGGTERIQCEVEPNRSNLFITFTNWKKNMAKYIPYSEKSVETENFVEKLWIRIQNLLHPLRLKCVSKVNKIPIFDDLGQNWNWN